MLDFESYAELDFEEVAVKVKVTHYQPFRDNKVGHIDDWLPDDPEEIEIAVYFEGNDVTNKLDKFDLERLENKALELIKEG